MKRIVKQTDGSVEVRTGSLKEVNLSEKASVKYLGSTLFIKDSNHMEFTFIPTIYEGYEIEGVFTPFAAKTAAEWFDILDEFFFFNVAGNPGSSNPNSTQVLTYETVQDAKDEENFEVNQLVYIVELRRIYYALESSLTEDAPKYRIIETSSGTIKLRRAEATLEDTFVNEEGLRVEKEIAVGLPGAGVEGVFGEGDSTTENMEVWRFDGTSYEDITELAASDNGSQFTFANNLPNNFIYIALDVDDNGLPFVPKGLKVKMATPGVYNKPEIFWTYFNGLSDVPLNVMSIKDVVEYPSYANQPFQAEAGTSEQILFNVNSPLDWKPNDPMGQGTAKCWVRIGILFPVNTLPIFEQFKVHTSRFELNPTGYAQAFGFARFFADLGWSLGDLEPAAASTSNQDVYLSKSVYSGKKENAYPAGADTRSGLNALLPKNLDTSSPVFLRFAASSTNSSGGNVVYTIRVAYVKAGDIIYRSLAAAPTVHPSEVAQVVIGAAPASEGEKTIYDIELDVSSLNANPVSGDQDADSIWVTFERTGTSPADTHTGTVYLALFRAKYVAWSLGGSSKRTLLSNFVIFEDSFDTDKGWISVPSQNNSNEFIRGSAIAQDVGGNSVYVSSDGVNAIYANSSPLSVCHFYRDFVIPADAVVAKMSFDWLCGGENSGNPELYDFMDLYFIDPTDPNATPVADVLMPIANKVGQQKYLEQTSWQFEEIVIPNNFIGSTLRVVYSYRADFSITNQPGGCIDNVRLSYLK